MLEVFTRLQRASHLVP